MKHRLLSLRKLGVALFMALAVAAVAVTLAGCGITLSGIEIECVKTEYYDDENFDYNSVTVNAVYSDGSKSTVSGWTVTGADDFSAGEHLLTVSYSENGKTVTENITITVAVREHEHAFGETLIKDASGHWFACACGEKSGFAEHSWKPKTEIIEEADCTTDGERVVTCSVCGYVTNEKTPALGHDFSIGNNDNGVHSHDCSRCEANDGGKDIEYGLSITDYGTEWFVGRTFELTGAKAILKCVGCGDEFEADITEVTYPETVFGEACEEMIITCTYGEYSCDLKIRVKEKSLIAISVEREKNTYDYALNAAFGGGKLTLEYDDDSRDYIDLTEDMLIDDFDTSALGVKKIYVSYNEKMCNFDIRVGYNVQAGAYNLSEYAGLNKLQAEDDLFVDMSGAQLQSGASSKFEGTANMSNGNVVPNGAEGLSTSNISVKDNKIVIRFASEYDGTFTLGIRAQSGSGSGRQDQEIDKAFRVTVNGAVVPVSGLIKRASTGSQNWKDMINWTVLDDIAGTLTLKKGLNEIEFYYLGEASTLRCPNIDYFTVNAVRTPERLEVEGSAEILIGGNYTDGLTLKVHYDDGTFIRMPVTADMISGLDTSTTGEKNITVAYAGLTATYKVTVKREKLTLTVLGGETADGQTSLKLDFGEAIPEINWTAQNIMGFEFDGKLYKSTDGLTMTAQDSTLKAITVADAKAQTLATENRFCNALDANGKPANNNVGDSPAAGTRVDLYGTNDAVHFEFNVTNANAQGLTLKSNLNFGSGEVLVYVVLVNKGTVHLPSVAFGTEFGTVTAGAAAAGQTVSASALLDSDGNNHWMSIVWGAGVSAINFDLAVYTYSVA